MEFDQSFVASCKGTGPSADGFLSVATARRTIAALDGEGGNSARLASSRPAQNAAATGDISISGFSSSSEYPANIHHNVSISSRSTAVWALTSLDRKSVV